MSFQIKTIEDYNQAYKKSVEQPEEFWGDIADNFYWKKMGQSFRLEFYLSRHQMVCGR